LGTKLYPEEVRSPAVTINRGSGDLDNKCCNIYCSHKCPSLKTEIKKTAPFSSMREEVSLNILRTAALLEHAVAERLKTHGLTPTQYNVLRILRGAGSEGLCRNEVRERMLNPVPDTTRLLDRLESAGLVVRDRSQEDRRFVTAWITDRGLALLADLDEPVSRMHEDLLGHMKDSDLDRLRKLLQESRENM
jgi:DNA-binding MarR family transcriptional regulator